MDSVAVEGIQVADAIAYCTYLHKINSTEFKPYWEKIYDKFRKGENGTIRGFGIKEFPKV